ncbi:MAG TPA: hypothetical protein VD999_01850 [Vitreimonas sp.]|nr:hypothetical protein [Vitreimonas sp.]
MQKHLSTVIGFGIVFTILIVSQWLSRQQNQISALEVGSLLHISKGFSDDKPSRGKVLAIDEINGQKVYGIQIKPVGEPTFTETKDGKKIDISTIGHLPISETTLKAWKFKITGTEAVQEEELDGYKMWKESGSEGW